MIDRLSKLSALVAACLLWLSALPATAGAASDATPTPVVSGPVPGAPWTERIDDLIGRHAMSVVVGDDGTRLYAHAPVADRTPASNQKLMLSIALLDALGPGTRLTTRAMVKGIDAGVVDGPLWIVGAGDPEMDKARLTTLAKRLVSAGLTAVEGSVRGSTTVFDHDWWAPGWKESFPRYEVALPTALAFNGNTADGKHIKDPERRAAVALTEALRKLGVDVAGDPGAGEAPVGLTELARVDSAPLADILRRQNLPSNNWYAETMGKLLGLTMQGRPGTIAKGAAALDAFAAAHDADDVQPKDGSGLSYKNVATADAIVHLLWYADTQPWDDALREALPSAGEGTLSSRLSGIDVRAKTGTLTEISALSGWVRNEASGRWIEFSILSKGMSKSTASHIEDRIVSAIANSDL